MKKLFEFSFFSLIIGGLATAFLDVWNIGRHIVAGAPLTKYELIGRWLLYMREGQFYHPSIRASAPRAGELIVGWAGHYAIGVLFAALLLAVWGLKWARRPQIAPAVIIGMGTIVIPYFLMQPGMGAGVAGSLSSDPAAARMKVVISHVVFSVGLYVAGWIAALSRPRKDM